MATAAPTPTVAATSGPTSDLRSTVLLVVAVFCALSAVTYGTILSFDATVMYAVTRAIVAGRLHLVLGQAPFLTQPQGDFAAQFPYSHYGIGVSLVELPLYGIARGLGLAPAPVLALTNPFLIALGAAVVTRIARALGWSARLGIAVALAYVLLTMVAQDSVVQFSEPGVSLGSGVMLLGLLRWRRDEARSGLLTGVGIGIAVLFRTDSTLLVAVPGVVAALFLAPRADLLDRARRHLVGFLIPLVPVAVWTAYYSHLATGHFFPSSYGGTFTTPFWTGFYGELIGPNKGFFFYNPWLLLAIPGAALLFARRDLVWPTLLLGLLLIRVVFYARWSYWFGGNCWGPRFLEEGVLPMSLLAGETLRALPRWRWVPRSFTAAVAALLLAWSAVMTAVSIWVPYSLSFLVLPAPSRLPGAAPVPAATLAAQTQHNALFVPSKSPWLLALHHLHVNPGPYLFRPTGSAGVGAAVALLGVAGLLAVLALFPPRPTTSWEADVTGGSRPR